MHRKHDKEHHRPEKDGKACHCRFFTTLPDTKGELQQDAQSRSAEEDAFQVVSLHIWHRISAKISNSNKIQIDTAIKSLFISAWRSVTVIWQSKTFFFFHRGQTRRRHTYSTASSSSGYKACLFYSVLLWHWISLVNGVEIRFGCSRKEC